MAKKFQDFINKKSFYYTNEAAKNMFMLIMSFAFSHVIFLILFKLANIKEMYYYNYFSVTFFLLLTIPILFSKEINLLYLDILITSELIVHQTLAIYFVGLEPGFQYIYFGMAAPLIGYTINKKYEIISIIKAVVAFLLFLGANIWIELGYKPVYQIENHLYITVFKVYIISIAFYTIAGDSLATYRRFTKHIKEEYKLYKEEVNKQIKMQRGVIDMVANIIEARDEDTGHHTERTTKYAKWILEKLKNKEKYADILTNEYIERVITATALHDIGKIKISDRILNKPGKLTPEEYDIIKTHTIEGGKIVDMCADAINDKEFLFIAHDIVLYHHERIDGKGYPTGISGKTIPFPARVMAVADVFDALTSKRVYKEKFDNEIAVNILKDGRGTQFDEEILDTFLECLKERGIIKE